MAPDGEQLVVDWTATFLHDATGAVRYLLCGLDVTARKQVEEEIRRSRARIVSAGDAERKRLERNLHDGAQQNLVSVSHAVHLAVAPSGPTPTRRSSTSSAPSRSSPPPTRSSASSRAACTRRSSRCRGSTRRSARSPAARRSRDRRHRRRRAALAAARRERRLLRRLRSAHERAQVRAGLVATIRVAPRDDVLLVEVTDDGCGGAVPSEGSGLGGLRDRVEALDGTFELESPPGAGTLIRAVLRLR